ncbi:MAG: T9SS type A sorting domain-containing protein, partial [Bacteroidales bacterium]|nr:T9SS type A sorting domain-containing protein [Bacteroidales bacterium]
TKSFMAEMAPQTNSVFFDPYGKAFFPNGMHSSVSVVNFAGGNEPLALTPGPNWISIPRLENNSGTYYMQADTIPDVFNNNRFAIPNNTLELEHNRVKPTEEIPYASGWEYISSEWHFVPEDSDNQNAFSYRGYILELLPDGNNTLYMKGQIKDPATTFPLYKDKKNWIGYFLVQEQDVFDALADHLDSITEIWHRNYYCYRPYGNDIIFGPEGGGVYPPGGPEWACTNSQHTIKYGEMIKVHPVGDLTGEDAFYWSTGSNEPPRESRSDATYYSYTETASYKPIVIELDTTQNPEEIGAFVNDTCVGACSVIEADTAVILMAYLDGRSADSIVFREYSSAKSSGRKTISSYLVFNDERGLFEKRSINTREGNERVLVSFKNRKVEKVNKPELDFRIWPNPTSDRLYYSFTLDEGTFVRITLFDITGKLMAEPFYDEIQAGSTRGEIQLKTISGEKLKPGIYLVKLRAGQWLETKKVIVK